MPNHEISLLVKLGINDSAETDLNKQIETLASKLDSLDLKINFDDKSIKAIEDLGKIDLSGLTDKFKDVEKSAEKVGDAGKKAGREVGDAFGSGFSNDVGKASRTLDQLNQDVDRAFGRLGGKVSDSLKNGISTVQDAEKAFEGLNAKITTVTQEINVDGKIVNDLKAINVQYENQYGILEKIKFSKQGISGDDGRIIPRFVPDGEIERINSTEKILSKFTEKARNQLEKLASESKITGEQFDEMSNQISKLESPDEIAQYEKALHAVRLEQAENIKETKKAEIAETQLQKARRITIEQLEKLATAGTLDMSKAGGFLDSVDNTKSIDDVNRLKHEISLAVIEQRKLTTETNQQQTAFNKLDERIGGLIRTQKISADEATKFINSYNSTTPKQQLDDINRKLTEQQQIQTTTNKNLKEQEQLKNKLFQLETDLIAMKNRNPKVSEHAETANIEAQIAKLSSSAKIAGSDVDKLTLDMKRLGAETREVGRDSMSMTDSFKVAMEKFPIWMAASTAFYGTVRSIKSAIDQIINLDSQMTVLRRVAGDGVDVNQVLEESVELAGKLGNLIEDVNDGFIAFARQGYRGEGLSQLTEYATLLGNISDLTVDEAASTLTAAMKGFGIEAERAIHIVDALNETDK